MAWAGPDDQANPAKGQDRPTRVISPAALILARTAVLRADCIGALRRLSLRVPDCGLVWPLGCENCPETCREARRDPVIERFASECRKRFASESSKAALTGHRLALRSSRIDLCVAEACQAARLEELAFWGDAVIDWRDMPMAEAYASFVLNMLRGILSRRS